MYTNELVRSVQPLLSLLSGHALDGLLRIGRLFAAVHVQEELAALGLVEGLLIAGRIAERAESALGDELRSFGIVFNLADNLLHDDVPFKIRTDVPESPERSFVWNLCFV